MEQAGIYRLWEGSKSTEVIDEYGFSVTKMQHGFRALTATGINDKDNKKF